MSNRPEAPKLRVASRAPCKDRIGKFIIYRKFNIGVFVIDRLEFPDNVQIPKRPLDGLDVNSSGGCIADRPIGIAHFKRQKSYCHPGHDDRSGRPVCFTRQQSHVATMRHKGRVTLYVQHEFEEINPAMTDKLECREVCRPVRGVGRP